MDSEWDCKGYTPTLVCSEHCLKKRSRVTVSPVFIDDQTWLPDHSMSFTRLSEHVNNSNSRNRQWMHPTPPVANLLELITVFIPLNAPPPLFLRNISKKKMYFLIFAKNTPNLGLGYLQTHVQAYMSMNVSL